MINLFDILLSRSGIKSENNLIDQITFYVAFRIILFCDEVHDFSESNNEINYNNKNNNIIKNVIDKRLELLGEDIFWYLDETVAISEYTQESIQKIIKDLPLGDICYNISNKYSYVNFIKHNRTYLYYLILLFYLDYKNKKSSDINIFLTNISNKILDFKFTTINDKNCKILVEGLSSNIFGITQMPLNYCSTFKSTNILEASTRKFGVNFNKVALFIDQIGASKNYCSVNKAISMIIEDVRETRKNKHNLSIINTLASGYDSSSATSLDKMIRIITEKPNLYPGITIYDENNSKPGFGNKEIKLYFGDVEIISFKFNEQNLTINQYFSQTIDKTRTGGKINNNSSNNSIKQSIVENLKNINLTCFKTMGDFLQIINTQLYENDINRDYATLFITGDIIAGNIAGLFLKCSILEKQTHNDEILIVNDALFMFYNIDEIQECKSIIMNNPSWSMNNPYWFSQKQRYANPFLNQLKCIYGGFKTQTYEKIMDSNNHVKIFPGVSNDDSKVQIPIQKITGKRLRGSEENNNIYDIIYTNVISELKGKGIITTKIVTEKVDYQLEIFGIRRDPKLKQKLINAILQNYNLSNFGKSKKSGRKQLNISKNLQQKSIKLGIKIKTSKDIKYIIKISDIAKKYRVPLNKHVIINLKKTHKIHGIAKKLKIKLTKTNKKNKRIYKTPTELLKEIKRNQKKTKPKTKPQKESKESKVKI